MNIRVWLLAILAASLLVLTGCGPSEEELAAQAMAETWAALETDYSALKDQRAALKSVRDKIIAGIPALDVAEGEDAKEIFEGIKAEADSLEGPFVTAQEDFYGKLVNFINDSNAEVGSEPAELLAAIRMKSDEDIELAYEFVEKGGDYRRALDIVGSAKTFDGDYARLGEVEAELTANRYLTKERFGEAKKGMTQDEVRALLGPVNLRNVREYEDQGAVGWFYQKDPEEHGKAAAAAVFFRKSKGELKVTDLQWTIKSQ